MLEVSAAAKEDLLGFIVDPSVPATTSDHLARTAEKGQGKPCHRRAVNSQCSLGICAERGIGRGPRSRASRISVLILREFMDGL